MLWLVWTELAKETVVHVSDLKSKIKIVNPKSVIEYKLVRNNSNFSAFPRLRNIFPPVNCQLL